jgi:phosphoribosylformylglycinamidine synthase
MAFAGGFGAEVDVASIAIDGSNGDLLRLFAESNSRFVVEVTPENQAAFESAMNGVGIFLLGKVTDGDSVSISNSDAELISESLHKLKSAWQNPLDFA